MVQIKRIPVTVTLYEFKVVFAYETRKGYYREQERTVKGFSKAYAKDSFNSWAKKQRTMVNAKILAIEEIEENRQIIEL